MSGAVIVQLVLLWLLPLVWAVVAHTWPWPDDQPLRRPEPAAPAPAPARAPRLWWAEP